MTTRVRETAPVYRGGAQQEPVAFPVTVGARGRLVLPAEVRERLKIKEGDSLTLVLERDGRMQLMTREVWADHFIAVMRHAFGDAASGRKLTDELIADRRREAAKEEREVRALVRRRSKTRR